MEEGWMTEDKKEQGKKGTKNRNFMAERVIHYKYLLFFPCHFLILRKEAKVREGGMEELKKIVDLIKLLAVF